MIRFFIISFALFIAYMPVFGQDTIYPISNLCQKKSFTYRLVKSEYIDNGNNYFVANTLDTVFLIFENTGKPYQYKVKTTIDEYGKMPVPNADTLRRIQAEIDFAPSGKVKYLRNWKVYRDLMVSFYSVQVRQGIITSDEFNELKDSVNKEITVRRMAISEISNMFSLCGDTFNSDIELLRVKAVRSPISDKDYFILGNLTTARMPGTKNSVLFKAINTAGPDEKKELMLEAKAYLRSKTPAGEPVTDLKSVGLNSEQEFQYNIAQGRFLRITLADVLALGMSSRGNVRTFQLWDIVE